MDKKSGIIAATMALAAVCGFAAWRIAADEKRHHVSAEQLGADWPVTVDSGRVDCKKGLALFRAPDGTVYGLTRDSAAHGYPHYAPIRKHDPKYPELFVSSSALITAARKFC